MTGCKYRSLLKTEKWAAALRYPERCKRTGNAGPWHCSEDVIGPWYCSEDVIGACRCGRLVNQCSEQLKELASNTGSDKQDTDRKGTMGRTGTGVALLRTDSSSTL